MTNESHFWNIAKVIGLIAAILGIFTFSTNYIGRAASLERSACTINPNGIHGIVKINGNAISDEIMLLENEKIHDIQIVKTDSYGKYQLTIGNLPKCWLNGDKIIITYKFGLTEYKNSALLHEGSTEVSITD